MGMRQLENDCHYVILFYREVYRSPFNQLSDDVNFASLHEKEFIFDVVSNLCPENVYNGKV